MNDQSTTAPGPIAITDVAKPPKRRVGRSAPRWEAKVRDRIKSAIKRFRKPLQQLLDSDSTEGDTRLQITEFLQDALGFELTNLKTEYQVKGNFADYAIRFDKKTVALIEVKRVGMKLAVRHLQQVKLYAVDEGVEWVILTNGVEWHLYHLLLTGGPLVTDLAVNVNLMDDTPIAQKTRLPSTPPCRRHTSSP